MAAGQREMEQAATVGAFVISDEASACVETFMESLASAGENGGWPQAIYEYAAAVDRCMREIRELARTHLHISD
jgi:hypothetical protein